VSVGVAVWVGVGVYTSTLIPGSGRTTDTSAGLVQPAKLKQKADNTRKNIFPDWIKTDFFNSVILTYLFLLFFLSLGT